VDYLLADSKGNSAESIRGMTEHYLNGTLAFIGPENTCAFEARTCAFVGPENTCAFEARDPKHLCLRGTRRRRLEPPDDRLREY